MNTEFDDVMLKLSDANLVRILNSAPGDYQPTALESAQREFDRRNLSESQVMNVRQEIQQKELADEAKANAPLTIGWKILACIFPGVIQLMFAGTFKADGYDRKAKEMFRWTLYGLGFYIAFIVLIIVLFLFFVSSLKFPL